MTSCIDVYEFKIAAGNNNAAGLLPLAGVLGSYIAAGESRVVIESYGYYAPGIERVRGNGAVQIDGFPVTQWRIGFLTWEMEEIIRNTYCSGSISGLVTVRTNTDNDYDSFANYNAVLRVPPLRDLERGANHTVIGYIMQFSRLVAL